MFTKHGGQVEDSGEVLDELLVVNHLLVGLVLLHACYNVSLGLLSNLLGCLISVSQLLIFLVDFFLIPRLPHLVVVLLEERTGVLLLFGPLFGMGSLLWNEE